MPLFANYRTSLMLVRRDKNFKKQNERIFAFLQYRKMNGFSWQQKFEPQIGKVSASYQIHISFSILWTWTGYIKIETGTQRTYQRNTFGVLQLPAQRKNGKAQNQSLIVSGKFCSRWGKHYWVILQLALQFVVHADSISGLSFKSVECCCSVHAFKNVKNVSLVIFLF